MIYSKDTPPRQLPLKLGTQVIVDTRDGATYLQKEHTALKGMLKVVSDKSIFDYRSLSPEHKSLADDFMAHTMTEKILGKDPEEKKGDRLLICGPMITWDACTHDKNSELIAQRMEAFVRGEKAGENDRELTEYLREIADEEDKPDLGDLESVLGGMSGVVPPEVQVQIDAALEKAGLAGRMKTDESGRSYLEVEDGEDPDEIQRRVEEALSGLDSVSTSFKTVGVAAISLSDLLKPGGLAAVLEQVKRRS